MDDGFDRQVEWLAGAGEVTPTPDELLAMPDGQPSEGRFVVRHAAGSGLAT